MNYRCPVHFDETESFSFGIFNYQNELKFELQVLSFDCCCVFFLYCASPKGNIARYNNIYYREKKEQSDKKKNNNIEMKSMAVGM